MKTIESQGSSISARCRSAKYGMPSQEALRSMLPSVRCTPECRTYGVRLRSGK
jgi:hypothetical protein